MGVRVSVVLCNSEVPGVTGAQSNSSSWEEHLQVTLWDPDPGIPGWHSLDSAQSRCSSPVSLGSPISTQRTVGTHPWCQGGPASTQHTVGIHPQCLDLATPCACRPWVPSSGQFAHLGSQGARPVPFPAQRIFLFFHVYLIVVCFPTRARLVSFSAIF